MARLVTSSDGRSAFLARRMVIHNATRNPMATRTPYVGIKKLPWGISFGSMFQLLAPAAPHIQQQQRCSNADRAVGNVERWKIVLACIHFDEIRHRAVYNAIVQISQRASQ